MDREEIARELQDKYENKNYYRMTDPKTPILINKYEKIADWHIAELENATKELKQKLEDERYIKATVIENAKREARIEACNYMRDYPIKNDNDRHRHDQYIHNYEIINQIKEADSE